MKQKNTKDDFEVRFEVMKVFSSVNLEKEFLIQEFFKPYKGLISNQRITNMKRNSIQLVKVLEEHDLIESDYKIISDGSCLRKTFCLNFKLLVLLFGKK